MGLLAQLGLLFKKNFILRKRHPGAVFLEVLWPVLVVTLIAVVRLGVPPKRYTTCHYQARAMPSAGITPFLQTFVCNIDNNCRDESNLKQAQEATYSVSALVQQLAPHLSDQSTVDALGVMNTGVRILDKLKELADDKELLTGIDDVLKVRTLFQDPVYVKRVLTDDFKLFSSEQADAFLNSTVNITYVFDLMRYPDFKSVVCSPEKLRSVLLFDDNINVTAISESLCKLSAEQIPGLINFLQGQIDIAEIVRTISTYERFSARKKDYSIAQGLTDVAEMIDLIIRQPKMLKIISDLSQMKSVPDVIRQIPGLIERFSSSPFDTKQIEELLNSIDPLIPDDNNVWEDIRHGVEVVGEVSDMFAGKWKGSTANLADKVSSILSKLDKSLNNLSREVKTVLEVLTSIDWSSLIGQNVNKTMNETMVLSSLDSLQTVLQKLDLWNTTAAYTRILSRLLDIGTVLLDETQDLENLMKTVVDENGYIRLSLTYLFKKGPNITQTVLKEFTDPQTISQLFRSSFSFETFCNDVISKLNTTLPAAEISDLKANLCHANVSRIMQTFLGNLKIEKITNLMNDTVTQIKELLSGDNLVADVSFSAVYQQFIQFQKSLSNFINNSSLTWTNIFTSFNLNNINLNERQWEPVLNMLDKSYTGTAFLGVVHGWGQAVQSNDLPPPIPRYIHLFKTGVKFVYDQLKTMTVLYSSTSDLGQTLHYWSTYLPEITRGSLSVMTQHSELITSLFSSQDWLRQICEDDWFSLMSLPSHVPVNKIQSLLCDTNWTEVVSMVMSTKTGIDSFSQEVETVMNNNNTFNTELDWTDILDYTSRVVDLVQNPEKTESMMKGPWNLVSELNFTRISEAVAIVTNQFTSWSRNNVTELLQITIRVLDGLDKKSSNTTTWRTFKHIIKAASAYARLMNSYYSIMTKSYNIMDTLKMYPDELKDYVIKMADITPDLIAALKNTLTNPDKLIEKLFSRSFKIAPDCSTRWLSDLLIDPTPDIRMFENLTCSLNWTKLGMEMNNNTDMTEYVQQIVLLSGKSEDVSDVKINWTETIKTFEKYANYLTGLYFPEKFELFPFNLTAIDMKWTDFVAGMEAMRKVDTNKLLAILNSLQTNINKLNFSETFGTNTSSEMTLRAVYTNLYSQYLFQKFEVTILEDFNSTREVDILNYLGSDEIRKLVHALEISPEVNSVVLDTVLQFVVNPEKISVFLNASLLQQLCSDVDVFADVFNTESLTSSTINVTDVQEAVCGLKVNGSKLLQELKDNWNGFGEFYNTIEKVFSGKLTVEQMMVNMTAIYRTNERLQSLLQSVTQSPPTFILFRDGQWLNPAVYEKQWTHFTDRMNSTLSEFEYSRIESLLAKTIPLLPKEEFQKVGLIMEKIVNIVKENIINMTSGSFTLNSMFVKIPLLHDIVSALNLSPDVLDVLLISPVVNPQRLAEVLLVPSTKEKFCEKSELWRDVLTLPATFNTSALNNAFCDQNTTNIINSLVKNLNLKTLITSLGNSSYEPDWKNVISQTQELVKNLNDLIANPPNFNFSKSLTGFQLYSSNTSKLWDFVSLYTTLNKIFENSSQFEAVQSQLKTLTVVVDVLNDILNKMKVTGVTLDLASLFKDSPSFTRMFKSFLSLNPDPVTGSLSIQLKPSQISAFSTVAADSNLLKDVFCNKSRFAEFFHVSGNVNITALLDSLCTVNFTNMATELKDTFMVDVLKQKLTDIEQNGRKFNLADYIKALKELQDKLTQLTTVQNVTFGQYNLDILADINSTALLAALMEQLNSVKNSYGDISVKIFDQIISLFRNSSSWRSLLVAFNAYDLILEHFNQYLTNIKGKPLSLELLVNNTDVDSLLIPLLKEPAWLSDLLKSSVKLDKLLNFVQSENAADILCSDELWDAFILPANGSAALKHLQDQACLMNKTILTWKTFVLQQLAYINKEADSGQLSLNSTKIGLDMKTAIELLTTMMSSIKDRTNLINQFINTDGFKSVLEKLNTTLTQRLSDLSNQWAMEAASLVWPSIKNNTAMTQMSNIISIANIFLDTINNKLSQVLANNISASSLLANSDELEKIVKAYINITKHDIDSWTNGNFSISKLTDLLRNSSLLMSKCADNSVAMYTSHSNNPPQFATDLQTIVCVYTNNLSDIFNNYSDIEQIRKKIEKMWGSDNTPDFSGYVSNINRFKSLISQLTQSHVTQVKQALDFSSLSKTFTSLGNNPSLIFRLLKPLGLVLSGALDSDTVKSALSTADSYFVLPFIKVLEVFHDKGVSVSSLFSDPSSVVKMAEYFGNYRNQLSLSLPIIIQPIFTSLWKEDGFRTAYLCNQSEISPLLHSLKLESIAGVLCNVSSLRWMDTLEEKGVDIVKIYGLAVQLRTALSEYHSKPQCKEECSSSNSCVVTCSASAANPQLSGDVSWFQLITDIERLTDLFQKDSVIVSPSPQNTTMTTFSVVKKILLNDTLSTILTQFKLLHFSGVTLSTDIWSAFRKYISFVSSLNSFFNNLTNKATGKTTLYLRDLLPDSHKVGEVINNIFGRTSAAEFLTATVNPSKFYSLAFTGSWKEIVCDKKKFTEIFKFEVGTDVDTVQWKLCDTATNKTAALKKLVDLFDAKAVLTQLAELFTQSTNSSSDISLFESVSDISEQLLSSLEKLTQINVDQESVGLWFKPVISTLQAIGNPGINTLNEACDNYFSYINGTEIHRQLEPVMTFLTKVMKLCQASFAITGSTGELSCDLFSKFDLLAVMRKLKEIGFWDIFKTINSLFDNKEQVKCSDMTDSVYSLVQSVNSSTQNRYFAGNTCPHSTNVSTVLGSLSQVLQFSSDMFNILQDSSIRQLLSKQDKLLPVLEFIFSVMSQQKTVILHMSDVLQRIEGKRPEIYLKEMLNLSPEIIKSFLNSAVNLNTTGFINKTTEEIEKVLCNETLLSSLMTLPEFSPINMSSLMRFVCTDRVRETALAIKSSIDTWEIFNQIAALTNLDINQVWFTNISTHIADVISNIDTISNLTSLFSNGFSVEKVRDSLPVIDKFILSSGPDRLVQNLQNVLDDIKHVIRNKDANMVIEDMKTFIDGVMGLGVVQSRLIEIIRVGDFLENPVEVKKYLEDLGIPKSVAVSILEGKYSLGIFLNMSSLDVGCSELFGNLIHPNTTAVQISELTRLFCSLNESMAIELSKKLVPNLNIGDLLKKYITMDTASMFEEVGVTKDELKDFTDKMSKAHNSLLRSTDFIKSTNNKTSEKLQELIHELVNLPQAQTASQSMSSMRPLLCGKSDKPLVEDAFQLKSFIDNQDTNEATDFFIKINTSSNSSLPEEDFCDEMFADIKKTTFGPIILAYLKPIMQGKILFSPNTKLTQSIVKKANRVFEIIEQVKNISNAWATGGPSLSSIIDQGADLQPLKKVLDNEFVKSLFKSSAGLNLDELMTGLDSLNSNTVNKTNIDSLTTAAKLVNNYITCLDLDRFVAMETEEELLKEAFKLSKSSRFLAGIVFDLPSGGRKKREAVDSEIPKHISYKIRMDTDNVRITNRMKSRIWYPDPESNFAEYMRYLRGFVQLQDIVDRAIISLQTNTDTLPAVYLKQFPFPCHNHDKFIYILGSYLVPVLMTFAWLASLGIITRNLVWDRENGQEVVFRIMGMKSSVNWFAWFMTSMCVMVIICFVITIIFTVSVSEDGEIYRYSNPVLIFFFLVCFCVSSAMMCFMISAFFTRVTLAILTVLIVYIFSYLPYIILFALEVNMQFWQKTIACLSSTTAFGFASMYIARLELTTEGLQWSNVNVSPIVGDPMTFQWACIMMMIDSFIYFIIGWYIRNVKPGKFGVPRPWYFPLTASYWCPRKHTSNSKLKGINGPAVETSKEGLFESAAVHLNVGMSVSGLSKKFGNNLVVKDLTAQFYEGQVTALLGHNGAAKTTTINLLLGLLEPTSGEVHIYNNYSAEGDSMIGVCPQHNALLQYMTVEEHMYLYAGIKCNWSSKQKKLEIQSLLQDVDLWHVRDVVVSTLSGGMQRRLCVALAFVGGSRAIVLDEPTSGIDPSTRKSIWNLISRNKPGRTILLSTHQMDEADNIGDRIIVMHKGQLLCSGSSTFLKQMLGGGYHLTVERALNYNFSSALNSNTKSYCNSQAVLNFIHRFLPSAELVEEVGTEIVIHLPYEDRQVTPFHQFFSELDQNQDSLCISSYGVSDTTLEDVFLKITSLADEGVKITEESLKSRHSQTNTDTISELSQETAGTSADPASRVTGCSLKTQQFAALMLKRLHHYRRDWRSLITIIILPFMLFLMAMGFALIRPSDSDMPSLLITPALYGPDNYMFIKDGYGGSNPVSNKLQTAFTSEPGIGTTCMDDFPSQLKQKFECRSQGRNFTQKPYTLNPEAKCQCWNWQQRCDPGADFPPPPELPEMTGNILQKLEGRDVSDYLLKSFNKFIELRYGGWSVEEAEEDTGNETSVQVWFNNKGYHALPSFFNGYSNALLRANVDPADKPAEFGITTYSHPITLHPLQLSFENLGAQSADAGIALVMLLAYSFIPAALMIYLVNERLHKEKQMQFISGVRPLMYWTAAFIWDLLIYTVTVVLLLVAIAIFRNGAYWEFHNLPATLSLVLLFGWAVIPMMYCTLRLFSSPSSAYMVLFCTNMFIGLVTVILIVVLTLFQNDKTYNMFKSETEILKNVFLIFPQFCLGQGLIDLTSNYFMYKLFIRYGENKYKEPFTFDAIGWKLVALAIEGVVFFILNLLIDSMKESLIRVPHDLLSEVKEDDDVAMERSRVQQHHTKADILVVDDLTKVFKRGKTKFLAVDRLAFGVNKGECFGLLGVNGAGKTTTFRMMTGDIRESAGSVFLSGENISGDLQVVQSVGYCPQDGGLDDLLTGSELLHFHGRLKGLSPAQRNKCVTELLGRLHLHDYADKPVNNYSGGTKRKLSLAIAMIADPPILFLDEPTTGMDPGTRRLAWKCISHTVKSGQSVVLTSHSMSECDALCSRLAIMVNGRFMCLGSGQHLKNKFGDGYTVVMHIQGLSSQRFSVEHLFLSRFPGASVKVSSDEALEGEHQTVMEVSIPRGVTSVAELFSILEQAEREGHISYYSLSQTTLDSVFLSFAHLQADPDVIDQGSDDSIFTDQSQTLKVPAFSNQIYSYTNPQFACGPDDIIILEQKSDNLEYIPDRYTDSEGRMSVKM